MTDGTALVQAAMYEAPGPSVEQRLRLLSPEARRRCLDAARDLNAGAIRNHEEMVDWAWHARREHFDRNRAELAPTDNHEWAVTRRTEHAGQDIRCDVVALTLRPRGLLARLWRGLCSMAVWAAPDRDTFDVLPGHYLEIIVTTQLELTGTLDNMGVAFVTRTEAICRGLLGPVQHDRVVGALVQ